MNLKKKDDSAGSNLTQIGDLLGAKGNQNTAEIVKEINLTDILSAGGFPKKLERTPEQKEALAELNKKVSSTGISYMVKLPLKLMKSGRNTMMINTLKK